MIEPSDQLHQLAQRAYRIRRYALRMGEVQGQGYIGQALGWADVLAVAYGHALNLRPAEPEWEGRDRFLLSHGHYAIAHYAALIEAGIIPESELETYGSDDSRLPMSGMASYTPGMEISGGSLGQGLAIGVGMALALRHKKQPGLRLQLDVRRRARRGLDLGGRDGRRPPPARQPDLPGRHQQPAGRRPVEQGAGLRAAGRQVGGLRLARAARRRQRPAGGAAGLRRRARADRGQAARHPLRHADGQGRALPRAAREEPLHPRRPARVAAGPRRSWTPTRPHPQTEGALA